MIEELLFAVIEWAASQDDIRAVALVGSHARGAASASSDVDLLLLALDPQRYLDDTRWAGRFGVIARQQAEDWGNVTSLRVWYADGCEVEYGWTTPRWAALPLDPGAARVISDGMRILLDRDGLLGAARPHAE